MTHPDGWSRLLDFSHEPWPRWRYALGERGTLVQEVLALRDHPTTVVTWTLADGAGPVRLVVRPLLSGRDYHALHRENGAFDFTPRMEGAEVAWAPYAGVPPVRSLVPVRTAPSRGTSRRPHP